MIPLQELADAWEANAIAYAMAIEKPEVANGYGGALVDCARQLRAALASSPPAPVPETMEVGEDTKRLDWLLTAARNLEHATNESWLQVTCTMTLKEARAAIDAARAQQSKDGRG